MKSASEIWGNKVVIDPLGPHFKQLFASVDLVDIAPLSVGPTWRNGRVGEDGICKRLDHFLFSSYLVPELNKHRVWAHPSDISNHFPIYLEWNTREGPHNYLFKFNRSWLSDSDFTQMVKRIWPVLVPSVVDDDMDLLSHKLRLLKREFKSWIKKRS